jgi:TonB family protein
MRKTPAFAILVLALCTALRATVFADDATLEKHLRETLRGRVFALRHPLMARSQKYGVDGTPSTTTGEGSWTVYGRIKVDKISVRGDELRVQGPRVLYKLESKKQHFAPIVDRDEDVMIAIRLDHAVASEDEALAILGRVFCQTPEDVANSTPELWRGYVKQIVALLLPQKPEAPNSSQEPGHPGDPHTAPDTAAGEKDHKMGEPGVSDPKPLYAPEPEFTEAARRFSHQGVVGFDVVVDPTGKVSRLKLVHALGLGLDEAAAETIQTWRFDPGKLNGRPVNVMAYIEVDFSLGRP